MNSNRSKYRIMGKYSSMVQFYNQLSYICTKNLLAAIVTLQILNVQTFFRSIVTVISGQIEGGKSYLFAPR